MDIFKHMTVRHNVKTHSINLWMTKSFTRSPTTTVH